MGKIGLGFIRGGPSSIQVSFSDSFLTTHRPGLKHDAETRAQHLQRYHKSQAIYLESKENTKISCVISSVGANEIWVRKTSDSTKMRIYLGQLQRGAFVIRRRSAA
ncbi:hypothetical protein JRQ81_007657 [Phrynocephalus forsythii]|uniref:Uncharacterized protein n=1 Tax=Phrynocephalus forsythii TaxID=171643 RepID=A0A9Q0XFD8_9SAUR|nr:hypothetical protein JRQ81_007657 [Phrynocephalus forsythii]